MRSDTDFILGLKKQYLSPEFGSANTYPGDDLGVRCTDLSTIFRLWCPLAQAVTLHLYEDGDESPVWKAIPMGKKAQGVWEYQAPCSLHGTYYTYEIRHDGFTVETGDPYATACGCNSRRCMVVDLGKTNPEGWDTDRAPEKPAENIIYELHVKEFSWQQRSGFPADCRGRYKAFTCPHTTLDNDGLHPTGLDYLENLGVTYIQIMPAYDYGSVDETNQKDFNWGYDPVYYNIPEGSYATDPHHGEVRIREFKEMIQALHARGFRVIMDVVYNHTYDLDSVFNQVVPWYYYRTNEAGIPSNGSACGNDIASEMPMAGKFILDSVLYWAREYHIDGFRFDLMGLLDVELMNNIRKALDERYGKGEKLVFGEPWAADCTALQPGSIQALKQNIHLLDENIGMFSDDIRDSIRGHVFQEDIHGFVTGGENLEGSILKSAAAWCGSDSQVKAPSQIITYISAHDNHTLWDKLGQVIHNPWQRLEANKLAAAIYMTCQGNLFMLSGEEFGRTKDNHDNTYRDSIELNRLDWERAYVFSALRKYYKGLIALRKRCPGLCDKSATASSRFLETFQQPGVAGYYLDNGDSTWKQLCVIYNRSDCPVRLPLRPGAWTVLTDKNNSFLWQTGSQTVTDFAEIPPVSALILGQ